jgi:hypothetical protein
MLGYSDKNEFMRMNVSDTYHRPQIREIFEREVAKEGFISPSQFHKALLSDPR